MRQQVLRPTDIAVALRLATAPEDAYEPLATALDVSVSTAHGAVRRLRKAGLVTPGGRTIQREALLEFLAHGIRFAFFAELGPETRGVPTAPSAPPRSEDIASDEVFVWPSAHGSARGTAVSPLYEGASSLPGREEELYRALALVEALGVGRARERKLALKHLRKALFADSPDP